MLATMRTLPCNYTSGISSLLNFAEPTSTCQFGSEVDCTAINFENFININSLQMDKQGFVDFFGAVFERKLWVCFCTKERKYTDAVVMLTVDPHPIGEFFPLVVFNTNSARYVVFVVASGVTSSYPLSTNQLHTLKKLEHAFSTNTCTFWSRLWK